MLEKVIRRKCDDTDSEIYRVGQMYRASQSPFAKKAYDEFIGLLLADEPPAERSRHEKMWEFEKE